MAGMNDIIMANPMGAIQQATQTAGAMDQLSRLRQQDQTMQADRGMALQDRQNEMRYKAMEYGARAGTALDSIQDPAEKAATYKKLLLMGKMQGFNLDHMPPEYNQDSQRFLDVAKAQVFSASNQATKYGTQSQFFRDPATGQTVAAQGSTSGGFYAGGKQIPSNWEPLASPNTMYSQDQQNYRLQQQPNIAGQKRQAESNVDLAMKPIIAADTERTVGDVKIEQAPKIKGAEAAGSAAIAQSNKAIESLGNVKSTIANFDDAIAAIDSGAETGVIASKLPSFKQSSIELDNVANKLGLNVIAGTTFGALSEDERKFAVDTALPRNMAPADLRAWLVRKKTVQDKLAKELESAAIYLGTPGNTPAGYMELRRNQIKAPAQQPPAQGGHAVGSIIEAGGKRYRVTGGDPNDPDVEEVQ